MARWLCEWAVTIACAGLWRFPHLLVRLWGMPHFGIPREKTARIAGLAKPPRSHSVSPRTAPQGTLHPPAAFKGGDEPPAARRTATTHQRVCCNQTVHARTVPLVQPHQPKQCTRQAVPLPTPAPVAPLPCQPTVQRQLQDFGV